MIKVRPTGILIEDGKILLLEQKLGYESDRGYSLPLGTLEENETIEVCLVREMEEETGLDVEIGKLLYICDKITDNMHILHITFLVRRIDGKLREEGTSRDTQKIKSAKMIPLSEIQQYGFSEKFYLLAKAGFPNAGTYQGDKSNVGL